MPGLFTTMLLVAAVASHTGGPASYDAELKCTARPEADDMPGWVVLLDLELLEGELEDNRERLRERLASLEIAVQTFACWAWLEAHYGAEVRNGAVFILTEEWLERTRQDRVAALEALVSAQDRHWEMTGEYAARVEDLPDFGVLSDYGLPDHLQLELSGTSGGWQARLEAAEDWFRPQPNTVEALYHCFAFAGDVPVGWEAMRRDGQPGPGEREPACFEPETLVKSIRRG